MPRVHTMFSRISAVVLLIGLASCGDSGSGIQIPGSSPGAVPSFFSRGVPSASYMGT